MEKVTKINLASGKDYREGYCNIDNCSMGDFKVDVRADVKTLVFEPKSVDEILVSHFAMYIDTFEMPVLLKSWFNALKIGGKLIIETGDLRKITRTIDSSIDPKVINGTNGVMQLFGWDKTKGHTWAWCADTLVPLLLDAGFVIKSVEDGGLHNRPDRDITIVSIK